MMKLLQTNEPINNTFKIAFGFKNWHCILPEDGAHVPKQVGEAYLMFVLIKNVHSVGILHGVC
jgi:hypothetical protein